VARGDRPEIPSEWPERYKKLITRCWDGNPDKRPDFEEILQCLEELDKELIRDEQIFVSGQIPSALSSHRMGLGPTYEPSTSTSSSSSSKYEQPLVSNSSFFDVSIIFISFYIVSFYINLISHIFLKKSSFRRINSNGMYLEQKFINISLHRKSLLKIYIGY
jgi:hypothetical protein